MKKRKEGKTAPIFSLISTLAFVFLSLTVVAQTAPSVLSLTNANNATTSLTAQDIKAMPHTALQVKTHDGTMHNYNGVLLYALLQKAGVPLGDSAKKKTAASYVLVTAADHYKTVYAMAEVDTLLSNKKIILADEIDGHALPQNALPYQVIATNEKIGARMIRQVVSIAVRQAE